MATSGYTQLQRVSDPQTESRWSVADCCKDCCKKICPCDCKAIDPKDLSLWDMGVGFLVVIIAILAPYETAFMHPKLDLLFCFNRFVDVVFIIDMTLQFLTAVPDPDNLGHNLKNFSDIAIVYLKGWFLIDLLSIAPVDIVLVSTGDKVKTRFKNLKAVRLLRLLRLFRLARLQRILERWQTSIGMNYSVIALIQFMALISIASHWMACLWGGLALQRGGDLNWLKALEAAKGGPEDFYTNHGDVYCSALYWAIVTLTSIGYGDITPQNEVEYIVATACMSVMAGLWAYVIGAVCGIVATLQPHEVNFKQNMDDLNLMMCDCGMPSEVRERLRRYFHEARDMSRQRIERNVIDQMSPALQGEVAMFVHGRWIENVPFLRAMDRESFISVARWFHMMVFAPKEDARQDRTLFIIQRGIGARRGKILQTGDAWGEDMLLENDFLRDTSITKALSYLHVLMLQNSDLRRVEAKFPKETRRSLCWARLRLSLERGIPKVARAFGVLSKTSTGQMALSQLTGDKRGAMYSDIFRGKFDGDNLAHYLEEKKVGVRRGSRVTLESTVTLLDTLAVSMSSLAQKVDDLTVSQTDLIVTINALPA